MNKENVYVSLVIILVEYYISVILIRYALTQCNPRKKLTLKDYIFHLVSLNLTYFRLVSYNFKTLFSILWI